MILSAFPVIVFANNYTRPINVPLASTTAWFDHDNDIIDEEYYTVDLDPATTAYDQHHGIDFQASLNTNVLAAATGTVKVVGWEDPDQTVGYGFRVYLYHSDFGQRTVYGHMASTSTVALNNILSRGDLVGLSGNTGTSTGPHLHFGVYDCDCTTSAEQVDPFGWWQASADPWPYNTNKYLWTTDPPSFNMASTVSSHVAANQTWRGNMLVNGVIYVNSGVTLTIEPGTIVKFAASTSEIVVYGTLDANGTAAQPIYFTSYKDDTVGGDTNDDGASSTPSSADWRSIWVEPGGVATMDHVILRYGGSAVSNSAETNIENNGGTLTLNYATSSLSANIGLRTDAGTTTCTKCEITDNWNPVVHYGGKTDISNSYIHDNAFFGIFAAGTGTINLTNNLFADHNLFGAGYINWHEGLTFTHSGNNSINGGIDWASNINGFMTSGNIGANRTWQKDDIPYVIYPYGGPIGTLVPKNITLTIDPGVVIKFSTTTSFIAATGTISAIGTSVNPIYFTSMRDDENLLPGNNDTNDDGSSTTPAKGDWSHIIVGNGTPGIGTSTWSHTVIRYGGGALGSSTAHLINWEGNMSVSSSTIATSSNLGIYHAETGGSTNISKTNIADIDWYGMYSYQSSNSNAENNYWNASDGPNPPGSGESVGGNVDFSPYWTSWIYW